MHQLQLNDELYEEAQRRAREAGFGNVDDFVADQLENAFSEGQENFDDRFTPEVITILHQISAEMKAGKSMSPKEVSKHLAHVREEWLKTHAG